MNLGEQSTLELSNLKAAEFKHTRFYILFKF